MRAWISPFAILFLFACGHAPEPTPTAASGLEEERAASQAVAEDVDLDRAAHMRATEELSKRLRAALMAGDLGATRAEATTLRAQFQTQSFGRGLKPYRARFEQALDDVVTAGSLAQAGEAVGSVALACGECHARTGGGSDAEPVQSDLPTQGDETMDERMVRHDVAVDQLWLGLTGPSNEAWNQASYTLASAPLSPPVTDDEPGAEAMAAEVERLREAARDIRLADSHVKRAQVLGRLLGRCAVCHQQVAR